MKELCKNFKKKLEVVRKTAEKYELSETTAKIDSYIKEIPEFKVTVPVVGGFSTGKSSLLNFVLGEELLSTNITPETAVPAEITYGNNTAELISENSSKTISLLEYKSNHENPGIKLAKIHVQNDFLSKVPTIKIVDMPGFDSGYELHNKAIDDYLPNSLAYIITVSADEGTLRESIISFLKELKLNEMPVYIVVTKSDKIMPDEIDSVVSHIRHVLSGSLSLNDTEIIVTSSVEDSNPEKLQDIFLDIQNRSDDIFKKTYSQKLYGVLLDIYTYLVSLLKKRDNSSEQLLAEKEQLEDNIKRLNEDFVKEKEHFDRQIENCVESIKARVASELSNSRDTIENLILQGSNISEKVNMIVRNTITSEINKQLDPKIQRYVSNISDVINSNMMTLQTPGNLLDESAIKDNQEIKNSLNNLITPVTTIVGTLATTALTNAVSGTVVGAALGGVLGPLGVAVGVIVGTLFGGVINKGMRQKEENQRREAARAKASEIISDVSQNAGGQIESFIYGIKEKVNDEIQKNISEKITLQEKALADAENKLKLNEAERTAKYCEIESDKSEIETMINEVRGGV